MKNKMLLVTLALVASNAAFADNKSGVITTLSATAYDSVLTNSQTDAIDSNAAAGAYAGFSGSYGGMSSSGVQIVAVPAPAIGTTGSGTYNAIGNNASSFTDTALTTPELSAAGVQGYGQILRDTDGFGNPTLGTAATGTVYLNASNGVQAESASINGAYDAHAKSITGQTASLMGAGSYQAAVVSGTGGMSQAGDLAATGFNANTASSGIGTSLVDLPDAFAYPLGSPR